MSAVRGAVTPSGRFIPSAGRAAPARWMRRIVPGAGLTLAGLLSAYLFFRSGAAGGSVTAFAGLLLGALVVLAAYLAVRLYVLARGLAAIHAAVRNAREGALVPIAAPRPVVRALGSLYGDYNVLARNLSSLFHEMEQCQLSIIGERNRNDAILHSLPGALLVVDGDFRITLSNRRAAELFQRAPEDLPGRNLFDLLDLDEAGRELLREAFLYEQPVRNKEIVLRNRGESQFFTLNLTFFKSNRDGSESCAVMVLNDITDHKRLQEVTHQTEKLAAMGQLAAGVAHELNTPLGTIIGYAQMLSAGEPTPERRQHYTQAIYSESKRCARIIDNLLAYARRDRCQPENCDINGVIRDVTETVNGCQGKRYNVEVTTRLEASPQVPGSAGQFEIVLVNLVMNAVQAAARFAEAPSVTVESGVEGAVVVIAITDNGPGIPPELRHRVFDPFFTTKEVGSGTGLGLAISHSIVTRVGGTLRCDAEYRGGARFVMTLPLAVN